MQVVPDPKIAGLIDQLVPGFVGSVSVLLGMGDGTFGPQHTFAVGSFPTQRDVQANFSKFTNFISFSIW